MWNYNFVLPEIIILVTFLIYYFAQPRLPIKLNNSFFTLIMIDLLTISFDVISALLLDYFISNSVFILRLVNSIFFMFFITRAFYFFYFTC
ncbi:MAG: hypothetical protein K5829_14790, partial [Treponema sp.]|nr:hypothetical protein [Treponema sp.]